MLGARAGSILIVDCESGQMEAAIEVPIAIEFSSLWPHLKKNWEIIDTVEGLLGWLYIPLKGQQIDVEHSKWKWREILIRLEWWLDQSHRFSPKRKRIEIWIGKSKLQSMFIELSICPATAIDISDAVDIVAIVGISTLFSEHLQSQILPARGETRLHLSSPLIHCYTHGGGGGWSGDVPVPPPPSVFSFLFYMSWFIYPFIRSLLLTLFTRCWHLNSSGNNWDFDQFRKILWGLQELCLIFPRIVEGDIFSFLLFTFLLLLFLLLLLLLFFCCCCLPSPPSALSISSFFFQILQEYFLFYFLLFF